MLGILYLTVVFILGSSLALSLPLPFTSRTRLFLGPALGLITITQLILCTSLILGFNHYAIFSTLFIKVLLVGFLFRKKLPALSLKFTSPRKIFQRHWPLFLYWLILGSTTIYIFTTKVWATTAAGISTGSGGLYGDTAMHSAYIMSLVEQGLPPANPLYAGQPLIYPFMVNLVAAVMLKLGTAMQVAFVLPQLIFFFSFSLLFYQLAKKFTANSGAFFALFIFSLGFGWGFAEYLKDVQTSGSWQVLREYTNNLPGFYLHNVLTGIIYPARSLLPGLVIGLLITHLAVQQFSPSIRLRVNNSTIKQFNNVAIGLLLGILPLWHTHTFLFFGVAVGIWILFSGLTHPNPLLKREGIPPLLKRRLGGVLFPPIIVYTITLIIALPTFFWFSRQVSQKNFLHFTAGWMNSGSEFLTFWFRNSGLLIPLALIGIWLIRPKLRFVFIPALLMFTVANLFTFQPWDWDNIKLLTWVFLFLSIPAGHFLASLFSVTPPLPLFIRGGWGAFFSKLFTILIFISLITSGALSLILATQQKYTLYDKQDLELASWVKNNTRPQNVFLIDPWPNHPIPGLTGRSAYLGYPGHLWVHGLDYFKREQLTRQILQGDLHQIELAEVPLNYLVIPKSQKSLFNNKQGLILVFENQKFVLYQVTK